jgi:hypothetical protein
MRIRAHTDLKIEVRHARVEVELLHLPELHLPFVHVAWCVQVTGRRGALGREIRTAMELLMALGFHESTSVLRQASVVLDFLAGANACDSVHVWEGRGDGPE